MDGWNPLRALHGCDARSPALSLSFSHAHTAYMHILYQLTLSLAALYLYLTLDVFFPAFSLSLPFSL